MGTRIVKLELPNRKLVVFDPATLQHRAKDGRGWMKAPAELAREVAAKRVVAIDVPSRSLQVHVTTTRTPADGQPLLVESGRVFVGDAGQLPSAEWGRRRWNLWDYLLALFALSLIPFVAWLAGFGATMLWLIFGGVVFFLVGVIPLTWLFFKSGSEFAKRTGTPPTDHPEQSFEAPPGTHHVRFSESADGTGILELVISG